MDHVDSPYKPYHVVDNPPTLSWLIHDLILIVELVTIGSGSCELVTHRAWNHLMFTSVGKVTDQTTPSNGGQSQLLVI